VRPRQKRAKNENQPAIEAVGIGMNDKAIFKGDYVDIKFIKSRNVAQVWIEIPIEESTEFIAQFGAPMPSKTVPVALARLTGSAVNHADTGEEAGHHGAITLPASEPERPKGGKLAQRAGILCGEVSFRKFLAEQGSYDGIAVLDSIMAADELRGICGISSRAELDHNPEAAFRFKELEGRYKAWLQL
jgi:hypothetical protein